ncbi:hypothetical protein [Streptobacillus canis]|uniref:hypothetical protein n=1 Tax=Streptobacillus canis TaxID=2678686 RepID=UPI0012E275EB|nr:hypothetical protein [Streptobacillus canis]
MEDKLKKLITEEKKLREELELLKNEQRILSREISRYIQMIKEKKECLKKLKEKNSLKISDGAILTYLEKIIKLNLSEIKSNILNEKVRNWINVTGDGLYPLENSNHKLLVKNNKIITVLPNNE